MQRTLSEVPSKSASEWASPKPLQEEEIHKRTRDDSRIKFPNFFFSLSPAVRAATGHQSAGRVVVFLTPALRQVDILLRRN